MSSTEQEWLSQRAYALWEEGGRREGQHAANWAQATQEYGRLIASRASANGHEILEKITRRRELMDPMAADETL